MIIKPNYFLTVLRIILLILVVTVIGAYSEYVASGTWWDIEYWVSLIIPFSLCPTLVILIFTPKLIITEENKIVIDMFFRKRKCIEFTEIKSYGYFEGQVFLIQPENDRTVQILYWAFNKILWNKFIKLLELNCKGKETKYWFGTKAFGK